MTVGSTVANWQIFVSMSRGTVLRGMSATCMLEFPEMIQTSQSTSNSINLSRYWEYICKEPLDWHIKRLQFSYTKLDFSGEATPEHG